MEKRSLTKKQLLAILVPFLLVMAGVFMGYFLTPSSNTENRIPATAELKSLMAERFTLAENWVNGLKEVYSRSGNDKEVWDELILIRKHGIPALPRDNGGLISSRVSGLKDFNIVVLTDKDKNLKLWGEMIKSRQAAGYSGSSKTLALVENAPISPLFKGIDFLHEVKHWMIDPDGLANADVMSYCRAEVVVHTFENRILLKIGGEPYQKLLDERTEEMLRQAKDPNVDVLPYAHYIQELNKIFGPSFSDQETLTRTAGFETGVVFQMVDRKFTGDKEEQKALYLSQIYQSNNEAATKSAPLK